jgi:site-specific DNA recombinase
VGFLRLSLVGRVRVSLPIDQVADLMRLFRKNSYLLTATDRLRDELGIALISITEGINTNMKFAKVSITMMGMGAELEWDGIKERTSMGRQQAAKCGKWVGGSHPPYGYYVEEKTQVLTVQPEEAKIVHLVFRWCVHNRLPTYEIQKRLNAMHIPTKADIAHEELRQRRATNTDKKKRTDVPKPVRKKNPDHFWHHSTVIKILRQQAYTGTYYYGKRSCKKDPRTGKRHDIPNPRSQWVPITCPAIIDPLLWEKAQERLSENKRLSQKNRKYDYLFGGRIVCGCCGVSYSGYGKKKMRKGVVTLYPQYRCRYVSRDRAAKACENRQISELQLEQMAWK